MAEPPDKIGVLLISAVSDFKGGAEVVMRGMLANPHIRPVLAAPEEGPLADAAAAMGVAVCFYRPGAMLKVHRPPRPGPMAAAMVDVVRCAFRLRRLAREHGCAILHSNGLKPHILCALLGAVTRARTLIHLHDIPYSLRERMIWRLIARGAARVAIVSRLCYPGAVLPANVQVVRNGIALPNEVLPPARTDGPPLRLGFVGRFHPNKGLDLLLDWFSAVRRSGIDATLTIRGRADPDLPEYWAAIQARIVREGLTDWVRDEGWVTGDATFAGLDILLVTSRTPDPGPLVVIEAMSNGVIVAGYPAGGIPGVIDDGRNGFLVQTPAELVVRLIGLLDRPDEMARIRQAAFDGVQQNFSMAGFYQRLGAVYAAIMQTRQGPDAV